MSDFPIVIGALGGSGTRVFAQILQACNVYMGDELNGPLDNITYSRLFRIPELYSPDYTKSIKTRLRVFEKYMIGDKLSIKAVRVFQKANRKNPFYKNSLGYSLNLLRNRPNPDLWGWKAPVSQLYISQLAEHFPNMKYIQVVRNGFDMAFSENLNQLKIWGHLFGIDYNSEDANLPSKQLDYWFKSNLQTIEQGSRLLGKNFKIINFEDFCTSPKDQIEDLLSFLNFRVDDTIFQQIVKLPKLPNSVGRYKTVEYNFSNSDEEKVKQLYNLIAE